MSEQTVEKENVFVSEASVCEMTRGEFMKAEHLVQTGQSETLPDGRNVSEVQKNLASLQKEQEEALRERFKSDDAGTDYFNQTVEVTIFDNGATSARPLSESVAQKPPSPASDIPGDFPGRDALIAAGVANLEQVSKLDAQALVGIKGIKDATAEKILAYGKDN